MKILQGNLDTLNNEHPNRKGWFIGSFIEDNPLFQSNEFEVKWAKHKKGYFKEGLKTEFETKTVTILITGKFQINFINKIDGVKKIITLEKLGDYVAYDASKVDHTAEAIENSQLIVFRWPSN